jgi:hypothetical protein
MEKEKITKGKRKGEQIRRRMRTYMNTCILERSISRPFKTISVSMALPDHSGPGLLFSSVIIFHRGRTPWASDQLIARPLPKQRTTQTQNKPINTPNIHALNGIPTHDPSVQHRKYAGENIIFLKYVLYK